MKGNGRSNPNLSGEQFYPEEINPIFPSSWAQTRKMPHPKVAGTYQEQQRKSSEYRTRPLHATDYPQTTFRVSENPDFGTKRPEDRDPGEPPPQHPIIRQLYKGIDARSFTN